MMLLPYFVGCKHSILSASTVKKCGVKDRVQRRSQSQRPDIPGTRSLPYYGFIVVDVEMNGEIMKSKFHVFGGLETDAVIGLDWLHEWQCELSFVRNSLWISLNGARVPFVPEPEPVVEKSKKKEPEPDEDERPVRKGRSRERRRRNEKE